MRHTHRPRMRGFTLVELMIVIVIIGILAAVAIPVLFGAGLEERRADAVRAAEAFGFSGVKITGSSRWSTADDCGWNSANAYQATATNSSDKKVSLVICCSRRGSQSCTVRVR